MDCRAEECLHWTGSGCACAVLGLEPVVECEYRVSGGSYIDNPPEYCELDSVPGERFCARHLAEERGE